MESMDDGYNGEENERYRRNRGLAAVGGALTVGSVISEYLDDAAWEGPRVASEILNGNPEVLGELSKEAYGQALIGAAGLAAMAPHVIKKIGDYWEEDNSSDNLPGKIE